MSERAVIVNGVPGVGKTTLSADLARALELPVVAKDAIKESLRDTVGVPLPTHRLGALASDVTWSLVGQIDGPVIVESFWFAGRDDEHLRDGLKAGGVVNGVEVWCEAPVDVIRSRFRTRARHPAHDDANRLDEWEDFAASARPMSGFPVIRVDTSRTVDVVDVAERIREALGL